MHLGFCGPLEDPVLRGQAGVRPGGKGGVVDWAASGIDGHDPSVRRRRRGGRARVAGADARRRPGRRRPAEFFRWKHFDNPFGPSFMLLAEADGRVIGLRAFMRWRFTVAGRQLTAVRAVDTATHPDYQGMGVFSRLTRAALDALDGQVDLVFNTPNDASRPGYLKLGWREVGRVPVAVRVRRPVRFGLRAAPPRRPPAGHAAGRRPTRLLGCWSAADQVERLLARGASRPAGRLSTPRDLGYLRWRYGAAPLLGYAGVVEEQAGQPARAGPVPGAAPGRAVGVHRRRGAGPPTATGAPPGGCWPGSPGPRPSTTSPSAPPVPRAARPGSCRPPAASPSWSSRCATASTPTRRAWTPGRCRSATSRCSEPCSDWRRSRPA